MSRRNCLPESVSLIGFVLCCDVGCSLVASSPQIQKPGPCHHPILVASWRMNRCAELFRLLHQSVLFSSWPRPSRFPPPPPSPPLGTFSVKVWGWGDFFFPCVIFVVLQNPGWMIKVPSQWKRGLCQLFISCHCVGGWGCGGGEGPCQE